MILFQVFLVLFAIFALLIAPVLAILALIRIRRLEDRAGASPRLFERLGLAERRLARIEERLAAILRAFGELEASPPPKSAASPVLERVPAPERPESPIGIPPAPTLPPHPPPSRETAGAPAAASTRTDIETMIAGRWLNRVGILAVLFAISFFLKYAFENNWIGPQGRIAITLLIGALLLPWSQRLLRRGYPYFSEGIAGLGAAVLYLSLWGGWYYYRFFSQGLSFACMIVVTGAMSAIAVGRDSQRVAVLALAGGLLTPLLLSRGIDQQLVLFSYLAVLAAGTLALARARHWQTLAPLCFIAAQLYFWGWYFTFYGDEKLVRTAVFATLFYLIFAALPVMRSQGEGTLSSVEFLTVLANALGYLAALRVILWPDHRWVLTLIVLALAAAHLRLTRLLRGAPRPVERLVVLLHAGLALTFVSLAIPIRLDGKWISIAWVVEGLILIWSGLRANSWRLRAVGLLLFTVIAGRLLLIPIPAPHFLLNARFATFAVAVACFAAAVYFLRQDVPALQEGERFAALLLGIAVNVYALIALSLEAWDLFGRMQAGIEPGLAQQLAISVVWILYATGLIVAGMSRRAAVLRWQSLVLFGLVVGKVFLFDLSFLQRFYRVISFLVLGMVLLLVSFFYQRKLSPSNRGSKDS